MELDGLLGQGAFGKGVENVTRLGQHLGNSSQGQAGRAKGACSSGAPASPVGGDKSCEELTRGRGRVWEKESFPLSLFFNSENKILREALALVPIKRSLVSQVHLKTVTCQL